MMKKKRRNALNMRYVKISKIALAIMAIMRLYSIWVYANDKAIGIIQLIQSNLQYNLLFIISMFDIMCCLYLFRIQKQMQEGVMLEKNLGILTILTITQVIFMNPIISVLLLLSLYSLKEQLYMTYKTLFKVWIKKENRLHLIGLSIVCVFFSSFVYISMSAL